MNRIPDNRYSEVIAAAHGAIPKGILNRLTHIQFLCGTSPLFVGLHRYDIAPDGRSYGATAHCVYPWHQTRPASERVTTIVLPFVPTVSTVIHELGHALEWEIGFRTHPKIRPVTAYAQRDDREAFAEAFAAWLSPPEAGYIHPKIQEHLHKGPIVPFFESLL